jgi:hypothetical protein
VTTVRTRSFRDVARACANDHERSNAQIVPRERPTRSQSTPRRSGAGDSLLRNSSTLTSSPSLVPTEGRFVPYAFTNVRLTALLDRWFRPFEGKGVRCHSCRHGTFATTEYASDVKTGLARSPKIVVRTVACTECGRLCRPLDVRRAVLRAAVETVALSGEVTGATFRFLREAVAWSAKQTASNLCLSPGTVSRWENGVRPPCPHAWVLMAMFALEHISNSSGPQQPAKLSPVLHGVHHPQSDTRELVRIRVDDNGEMGSEAPASPTQRSKGTKSTTPPSGRAGAFPGRVT